MFCGELYDRIRAKSEARAAAVAELQGLKARVNSARSVDTNVLLYAASVHHQATRVCSTRSKSIIVQTQKCPTIDSEVTT